MVLCVTGSAKPQRIKHRSAVSSLKCPQSSLSGLSRAGFSADLNYDSCPKKQASGPRSKVSYTTPGRK